MSSLVKKQFIVERLTDCTPEISPWLWALEDARRRTRREVEGVHPMVLDWTAIDGGHSIGTLLYHIAAIELDWLHTEVLQQEWSPGIEPWFPHPVREENGSLTPVRGETIDSHWQRLNNVRGLVYNAYCSMTLQDFRRPRQLPEYDVTPEWILHHLMQHEAEHRGEIGMLRIRAEKSLGLSV